MATKTAPAPTRAKTPLIVLFAPMLTSLALIAAGAILDAADIHNPIVQFVSSPVIALLIGLVGTSLVGRYAMGAEPIQHAIATGFKELETSAEGEALFVKIAYCVRCGVALGAVP